MVLYVAIYMFYLGNALWSYYFSFLDIRVASSSSWTPLDDFIIFDGYITNIQEWKIKLTLTMTILILGNRALDLQHKLVFTYIVMYDELDLDLFS